MVLCGRNAECRADDHAAVCSCKSGFFGNAKDDKIGCQPIECEVNDDCSAEKICDAHKCRIACLAHNPCGVNAICTAERHVQVVGYWIMEDLRIEKFLNLKFGKVLTFTRIMYFY